MPGRKRLVFAILVLVVAAMIGTYALLAGRQPKGPMGSGEALIGGPFTLTDDTGKQVTDADYRGRFMLIFFGYTHCPDICPTELQVMTAALDMLGSDGQMVQPLFITIDPARDTPDVLRPYVERFGSRLVGLTGTPAQIAAVAKAYHVEYRKIRGDSPSGYQMEHTIIIYLMGPDGRYGTHFTYTTDAAKLAKSISDAMASSL